ncbi:MAG: hypothetical protein WBR15_07455 [Gammaproteobacteria bacterium]
MSRRYALSVFLSILVVVVGIYGGYRAFRPSGLPFTVKVVGAHVAVIEPLPGIPLPAALRPGDRIDLPALDAPSRMAITIAGNTYGQILPLGHSYELVIRKASGSIKVPVTTVDISRGTGAWSASLSTACLFVLMSVIALMLLWRGRDRAAAGMALWSTTWMIGVALESAPLDGVIGIAVLLTGYLGIVLSRVGFYIMIESMLHGVFKPRMLLLWRLAFATPCAASLCWVVAANLWFPVGGSAIFLVTGWGSLLGVSYFIPILMLYFGYHAVDAVSRARLRWMLWSGSLWVLAAVGSAIFNFESFSWNLLWSAGLVLAACGFVYAVLRHRVVSISLILDRTLVYASVTALVVGVLAAVNSLVRHAAIGSGASLLIQVIVPLALGIVLGQVRNYANRTVERLFFRRRYLAEKALRAFARHCAGYERTGKLLVSAALEIHKRLKTPAVATYVRNGEQYTRTQYAGEPFYPLEIKADDPAFAAARTGQKDLDLSDLSSGLGTGGHVFPMFAEGVLQAMLVCADRPGERYAADERKLLVYVARQVGMALHSLRLREALLRLEAKSNLIDALANSAWPPPEEIQAKARELATATLPG